MNTQTFFANRFIHRFFAPLGIDAKLYRAKLTVKETTVKETGERKRFYDQSLTEIEKADAELSPPENSEENPNRDRSSTSKVSITDLLKGSISDDGTPYLANGGNFPLKCAEDSGNQNQPEFYSAVERAIENSPQSKFSGEQAKAMLNPAKGAGIKQEELDWLGIDEFLQGKDKVTKDEL